MPIFILFFLKLDCDIDHWNSAGITEGFSMCGGDFVEVYGDPNQVGKKSELLLLLLMVMWLLYINKF